MSSNPSPTVCDNDIKSPLFSFVIPAYAEENNIENFLTALESFVTQQSLRYEIIVVDDGSPDKTADIIVKMADKLPMKCVLFSRNFGKEQAITAGLKHASGDAAIIMDADLQHPFSTITDFIKFWRQGYNMVYGIHTNREHDGIFRRSFTKMFYKFINLISDVPIQPNAGDFRLIDRKTIDALNGLPESGRFMKGLYSWVGFKSIGVPFKALERAQGQSTYNFKKLVSLATIGLTSFSVLPLRIATFTGVIVSVASLSYAMWVVIKTLLFGISIPGWSTLVSAVLFLGGIQLIAIGVLGEYIGHIFMEVKNRPLYIISKVHDSTQSTKE